MQAAAVIDRYRFQPRPYRGQAQAGRLGAGQKNLVQGIQVPDGAGGGEPLPGKGHIHQGQIPIFPIHIHRQGFAVASNPFRHQPIGRHQTGGQAGQSPLGHCRENIVGAGGNRHQGEGAAAPGHGPVRPIAAQGNQALDALVFHQGRRPDGVALSIVGRHFQQGQAQGKLGVRGGPLAQLGTVGHRHYLLHAYRLEAQQDPAQDVDLFPIRHDPALGDQPANVLAGRRIGDYPYCAQRMNSPQAR